MGLCRGPRCHRGELAHWVSASHDDRGWPKVPLPEKGRVRRGAKRRTHTPCGIPENTLGRTRPTVGLPLESCLLGLFALSSLCPPPLSSWFVRSKLFLGCFHKFSGNLVPFCNLLTNLSREIPSRYLADSPTCGEASQTNTVALPEGVSWGAAPQGTPAPRFRFPPSLSSHTTHLPIG
ncbi:hypothetical protein MPNT_290009 [Candidatus Methylacidithermus pantelleriae]|uniref:Uncharacterized protein n=1 Tax=Candidatus Methylacidithermus pantelleriae TaxID=2744239 RepID=A0A8J2BJX8_9BACT|nr:hypothetical protein MPNT_290009 [Candidatus Methylacidithermus pantelleriae]